MTVKQISIFLENKPGPASSPASAARLRRRT